MCINDAYKLRGLIDSGATVCAIKRQFCEEHGIKYQTSAVRLTTVAMSVKPVGYTVVKLSMGPFSARVEAFVMDLKNHDFILGLNHFKTFHIRLEYPFLLSRSSPALKILSQRNAVYSLGTECTIEALNKKYVHLFSSHDFDVGLNSVLKCNIKLAPDAVPHHVPARRLALKLQQEERKQIETLLRNKLIAPSYSEWAAGITFVCRENKRPRSCGDYRALNKMTVSDRYPIPRIDYILMNLGKSHVYSKLDLTRGYNNIEIAEEDSSVGHNMPAGSFAGKLPQLWPHTSVGRGMPAGSACRLFPPPLRIHA